MVITRLWKKRRKPTQKQRTNTTGNSLVVRKVPIAGILGLIGAAAGLGPDKPDVPAYKPVSVGEAQSSALKANLGTLPQSEQLAASLNVFNQQQLQAMLEKAIPNYAKIKDQVSANILSMLKGEIPDATQVATRAAEKAVGGGFGGTEASRNLTLRDLSIDSLKYTQAGITAADRWLSSGGGVPALANPSSMFVTPAMELQTEILNTENQFQRDWLANRISAAPSYLDQQAMGTLDVFDTMGQQALGFFGGSALGSAMRPGTPSPAPPSTNSFAPTYGWGSDPSIDTLGGYNYGGLSLAD